MSFPKFRNFQITEKRLTLRKNERHFRTQRTKKHQETPKNKNKKKTRPKICCPVSQKGRYSGEFSANIEQDFNPALQKLCNSVNSNSIFLFRLSFNSIRFFLQFSSSWTFSTSNLTRSIITDLVNKYFFLTYYLIIDLG